MKKIIKTSFVYSAVLLIMTSCFKQQRDSGSNRYSENIGYDFSNPEFGGLSKLSETIEQEIPPTMVAIEGGIFVMGQTQQDVMGGTNSKAKSIHVQSFYIDDSEVSNKEYLIYLDWLAKVFPKSNPKYKHIYTAALPDTTVWRNPLGYDGNLPKTYLRHRAYEDYPVVGVSWLQANDYCKWRTDRVAEKRLVEQGILQPLYTNGSVSVEGRNHFDIEVFEANPNLLFDGDKSIYTKYVTQLEEEFDGNDSIIDTSSEELLSSNNKLNIQKQSPTLDFRLPTEVEWEYAAKADIENRFYNTVRGRKKYAWQGESTRDEQSKYYTLHANFKQKSGDYSGIAGWSSDYGDITTPSRSFPPNAYGLYDMSGNVAEWVFDVYRPTIDSNINDFNYSRGNIYRKPKLNEDGNVIVASFNDIVYDTLPNGKIVPSVLPGQIIKENITSSDIYLNPNYKEADNKDFGNGDSASSIGYDQEDDGNKKRMYNSPVLLTPTVNEETGEIEYKYDEKTRTSLITDYSRVYKGGSWKDRAYWLDPSQRRFLEEYMSTNYIGFRCAITKVGEDHKKKKRTPFFLSN